jgi:hypothetical protein
VKRLVVVLCVFAVLAPGLAPATSAASGGTYQCPLAVTRKLGPLRQRANKLDGRLLATRKSLSTHVSRLKALDKLYPGRVAPTAAIAHEYNALLRQTHTLQADEKRLVAAYNRTVSAYNRLLHSACH